jgi:hypothetical protein
MAILTQEIEQISGGFSKEINKAATGLMFNILQQHQYSRPIPSTIREIVSNGLDSITEKRIAREILTGQAKVEDYYIQQEGEIYSDSKFDASYYDLQFLSAEDDVMVIYQEGGELEKDTVIIRDHGVGLGGKRMEGYFDLGFSSKRLLSSALGKFGIGAKSPLSVGVPFYTITSRHNGKEFCFNVYSHRVESVVPQFDMSTEQQNQSYTFSNGYIAYYKKTIEPNMLQIEITAKKHHKQQYIDAVTSQLLYFKNVRLFVGSKGNEQEVPVLANIMYEDDMIVLSRNSNYSKPHLLLNGVNYGYIQFDELELEQKLGNIGIKVDPSTVSINPSRENLIWDDKTRETIISRFNEVVQIAQTTINSELKETDFLKWLKICASAAGSQSLWSSQSDDTVIGRLSRIVDMSKVELSYPLDSSLRFSARLMDGVRVQRVEMVSTREGSKVVKKVEYQSSWRAALQEGLPIIIVQGEISNKKNKYILTHLYKQGFVMIQLSVEANGSLTADDITNQTRIEEAIYGEYSVTKALTAKAKIANLHNYIFNSKDKISYESIVVPDNFKANDTEAEEEIEEKTEEATQSAAERRKLTGSTIVHTPRTTDWSTSRKIGKAYEMQKVEFPIHLVDTWNNEEIFWSNQDFEPLLHTVALITRYDEKVNDWKSWNNYTSKEYDGFKSKGYSGVPSHQYGSINGFYENSPVRLIKVAQQNVKYYRDFKHITKFFKEIKNKTITMANALVRWNTARLLQEKLSDLTFLNGFKSLSAEKHTQYIQLKRYVYAYWRSLNIDNKLLGADDTTTGQLISHMDKVGQFQLFVKANPEDKESIAQLAQELFNPEPGVEIQDGRAIDTELYEMYLELLDWAQPVKVMLNMVQPLYDSIELSAEQEEEIRHYLQYRGVTL